MRWLRDRNQELERVVEALRKTIMRQAELSSQRQDHQGVSVFLSRTALRGVGKSLIFTYVFGEYIHLIFSSVTISAITLFCTYL